MKNIVKGIDLLVESGLTLQEVELCYIRAMMVKHGGKKPLVAKELGISLKTLYTKLHFIKSLEILNSENEIGFLRRCFSYFDSTRKETNGVDSF